MTRPPDFFIVGHPKTGTTALYDMLRAHPQIFLSRVKEPGFLAPELLTGWTLERYLALFADARDDQMVGEATSHYLMSAVAPDAIARMNPNARAIAIFRNPPEWIASLHLQYMRDYLEDVRDLREALRLEPDRRAGRHIPSGALRREYRLQYTGHVRYTEQLQRLQSALGADQVHVVIYDDLRSDPASAMADVLAFLGVDSAVDLPHVESNVTVRSMRFPSLDRALHRLSQGSGSYRFVKPAIKRAMPKRLRRRAFTSVRRNVVFGPVAPLDADLDRELRTMFKPEVERFGAFVGRDLATEWGYD
ncbi:MAG TPA: sulfotransferase [Gaiellaceae bacterium]